MEMRLALWTCMVAVRLYPSASLRLHDRTEQSISFIS